MCGILGSNFYEPEKLKNASKLIAHRGTDDEGIFHNPVVSLIHRRLSILDLSPAGHQPMFYCKDSGACSEKFYPENIPNTQVGIVYNGEIYNYRELKAELTEKNYRFSSNSDTELILAAYLAWGEECTQKFNGMWAFCLYDSSKNILFLSRDRLGIKPLYFFMDEKRFVFSSELKALLELGLSFEINKDALNHFLIFGYTSTEQSILEKAQKLSPGENMIYHLGEKKITTRYKYWKPIFSEINVSKQEASKKIYSLLEDAVTKRLLSDVDLGAFLSGGIDSSVIVYFMKKHLAHLNTFSVKFDKEEANESQYAAMVAKIFNTSHHEVAFSARDVENLTSKLAYFFDEPFGDESMIPTYLVSKVASNYVKVVLSGTGSDEIFGGYRRYNKFLILAALNRLPNSLKYFISTNYQFINKSDAQKIQLLFRSRNQAELYSKLTSYLARGNKEEYYDLSKYSQIEGFFEQKRMLNNALSFDQNYYLPADLLVKEDRATMAHTIEGRVPFLDYRLVEYANSLPVNLKIHYLTNKYILKESFKHILPKEIIYRKKQGFGVPLGIYFRDELKNFAYEQIFYFDAFEYYDKKEMLTFWQLHQDKKADYSSYFWRIINFNQWYKQWSAYKK
jgi:asparagine synthase (glutamine-hydrolysing)